MSEPDEVKFACIGCGTYNPATAQVCAGCGHRFAGPDLVPRTRIVLPPRRASANPFEPPIAPIAPIRTFQIGSMLVLIALIAVCLASFRASIPLGVVTTLSFVPATIWTSILARNRRAIGRPMPFEDRLQPFLVTMLASWAVVLASVIAFCATCVSAGVLTNRFDFALVIGILGAVGCGWWLTARLVKNSREWARQDREIRYR